MVYATGEFLFIHIPRTGGTAMHEAIRASCAGKEIAYVTGAIGTLRKHSRACELKLLLGSEWDRIFKFACIRHPIVLAESLYAQFMRETWMDAPDAILHDYRIAYYKDVERFRSMTFGQWLRDHLTPIIETGGWWSHFCEEGLRDLGVVPIKFEELPLVWEDLQQKYGFENLSIENRAPRTSNISWERSDIEFVRDGFSRDFERFGYS